METSVRVGLLLLGFLIVAGIIWDTRRNSKKAPKSPTRGETFREDMRDEGDLLGMKDFEEESNLSLEESVSSAYRVKKSYPSQPTYRGQAPAKSAPTKVDEILAVFVMAKPNTVFSSRELFEALNEAHLFYGDMQIFHRYENIDGSGKPMFSLALAVEPGFFEVSKMETLETPGVTLFFTLTRPNQSIAALELMLRTAKQLALKLNGDIKDDKQRLLTMHTVERYRDRVKRASSPVQQVRSY